MAPLSLRWLLLILCCRLTFLLSDRNARTIPKKHLPLTVSYFPFGITKHKLLHSFYNIREYQRKKQKKNDNGSASPLQKPDTERFKQYINCSSGDDFLSPCCEQGSFCMGNERPVSSFYCFMTRFTIAVLL